MPVDPIKPTLKPPGTKRLKPDYDEPVSNFAFKFDLRRYIWGLVIEVDEFAHRRGNHYSWQEPTLVHFSAKPDLFSSLRRFNRPTFSPKVLTLSWKSRRV